VLILVVHPDRRVRRNLVDELRGQWSETQLISAGTGRVALRLFRTQRPDVVLLATDPADRIGFDLVRDIRRHADTPLLLLSTSGADADQIEGLRLGADDCVVQPVSAAVLAARIDAILRRGGLGPLVDEVPDFQAGPLAVWFRRRLVTVAGEPLVLTPLEYKLLYHLVRQAGEVVPSQVLLDRVWGVEYGATTKYLKVFINRLRSKLGPKEDLPSIQTVRRVGYRLVRAEPSSANRSG